MPKLCQYMDYHNRAYYGKVIDFKPLYCKDHKNIEEGLISIANKCKYCKSCYLKIGCYGFVNEQKKIFCKDGKSDDMINIISKRCLECHKQPIYGFTTDKSP